MKKSLVDIVITMKDGRKIVFTRPLEFGEGTKFEYLWNDGYEVSLGRFLFIKYLIFEKRKK